MLWGQPPPETVRDDTVQINHQGLRMVCEIDGSYQRLRVS